MLEQRKSVRRKEQELLATLLYPHAAGLKERS